VKRHDSPKFIPQRLELDRSEKVTGPPKERHHLAENLYAAPGHRLLTHKRSDHRVKGVSINVTFLGEPREQHGSIQHDEATTLADGLDIETLTLHLDSEGIVMVCGGDDNCGVARLDGSAGEESHLYEEVRLALIRTNGVIPAHLSDVNCLDGGHSVMTLFPRSATFNSGSTGGFGDRVPWRSNPVKGRTPRRRFRPTATTPLMRIGTP
jgi:hypothetical protein